MRVVQPAAHPEPPTAGLSGSRVAVARKGHLKDNWPTALGAIQRRHLRRVDEDRAPLSFEGAKVVVDVTEDVERGLYPVHRLAEGDAAVPRAVHEEVALPLWRHVRDEHVSPWGHGAPLVAHVVGEQVEGHAPGILLRRPRGSVKADPVHLCSLVDKNAHSCALEGFEKVVQGALRRGPVTPKVRPVISVEDHVVVPRNEDLVPVRLRHEPAHKLAHLVWAPKVCRVSCVDEHIPCGEVQLTVDHVRV
mmetsp:Transcript_23696/g.69816  ORF Transcript_23696/g.69816 Transcript_23696/m.69816 type:complete len:248 (+) Transcript_23696:202-945(+)